MNLYLIRHGKAEPASANKKDRDRELTNEGINSITRSVASWKERIKIFDVIISSPFTRAFQTAELVAQSYSYKNKIIVDSSLSPGSTTNSVINLASAFDEEDIAFVGHQPDLGYHLEKLVCNSELRIKFAPAAITKIAFDAKPKVGKGTLFFLLPPI